MARFKRKVFYLSGFDPRGGRFYHALLAEQVTAHNGRGDDAKITLSGRSKDAGMTGWQAGGESWQTAFTFLGWDDLVRRYWVKGPWALLSRTFAAYWRFIVRGNWPLAPRLPAGSKIALFYPGATMLLLPVLLALLLWPVLAMAMAGGLALIAAALLAIGATLLLLPRIHSLWLVRFVIFNDMLAAQGVPPDLDARLNAFAAEIAGALEGDCDEVLLVTHSNGGILAVPLMLKLLELRPELPDHFSLVTLGSCTQLIAARKDGHAFHAMFDALAGQGFRWLDIASITDGACVPLVDPFIGRPVSRPAQLIQPSPRWFRYSDPAAYARHRRNKYEVHFDYLRRLALPSPLDYLGITCCARPLAQSIAAFEADNVV